MAVNRRLNLGLKGEAWVVADADTLAREAASLVNSTLHVAVTTYGKGTIALSGGSTPKRMGQLFAEEPYLSQMTWPSLEIFWGDERFVPLSSDDSNAGVAMRTFLDQVPVARGRVHPWQTVDTTPAESAANYQALLGERLPVENGHPRFDLVLLGMGADGHTASLFPGTTALDERTRSVAANHVPQLDTWRLTLTYPTLNAASEVIITAAGEEKADALEKVFHGPEGSVPIQGVRPTSAQLVWLLDRKSAAKLRL